MGRRIILKKEFFSRATPVVAKELLGKYLVRKRNGKETAHMITEAEAYDGFFDKASHAYKGKTPRAKVMFGEPGIWYVYLVYGMHEMLNVVTGERDYPAAVLIRGVEGINGPGKLTKAFSITRAFNNKKAGRETGLWIEDRGTIVAKKNIASTPRVGVHYAGSYWAGRPWRFVLLSLDQPGENK